MTSSNRRTFLKAVGVTSAAAGASVVVPAAASAAAPAAAARVAAEPAVALPAAASGPLVAYIRDVTTGEIAVMLEGREVTVTDHSLVAKLAHAIHSTSTPRPV